MKRIAIFAAAVLMAGVLCASACFAAENDAAQEYADNEYYTIPEWNIMIVQPENAICADEGDGYYIYTEGEGYIPFVMVTVYDAYETEEDFYADFNEYLKTLYDDLEIVGEAPELTIDDGQYYEVDYTYTVEDAQVYNRCIARVFNGITYMFTSKEVPDLDLTVGTLLEDVVEESWFLAQDIIVPHDTHEIRWEDNEAFAQEFVKGSIVPVPGTDFEMYVPDDFEELELTDDDIDNFFTYVLDCADGMMTVQNIPVEEFSFYDNMDYLCDSDDVYYIDVYLVNGVPFIKYEIPDSDMMCLSAVLDESQVVEFSFWPISEGDMSSCIDLMGSSIVLKED